MSLPAPVAGCRWPASATMRPATKATTGGGPVHSFATLLENLVTIQLTASSRRPACPPSPSSSRLPHPALSLRAARRLLRHRVRVGTHLQITAHFRRQMLYRAPMQGNFGLGGSRAMSRGMSSFPLADLARRHAG